MADDAPEWSPPQQEKDTGVALYGDLPLNHRLRAEALADAGATSDPDGLIEPDLIASTAERLQNERAEAERNTPSMRWSRDELADHAEKIPGVVIEDSATKSDILDAINAAPAAPTEA